MEPLMKGPISVPNICEWCGGVGSSRCGRCHVAYYCCREHQMEHWVFHKKVCKKSLPPVVPIMPSLNQPSTSILNQPSTSNLNQPSISNLPFSSSANWNQCNVPCSVEEINQLVLPSNAYSPINSNITSDKPVNFNEEDIFPSFGNELLSSDNNFWGLIDTCNTQNLSELDLYLGKNDSTQITGTQQQSVSSTVANNVNPTVDDDNDLNLMECVPFNDICINVVRDLNTYGICVLDKFLGSRSGNLILEEVKSLYGKGVFKKGQIVGPKPYVPNESVRSDLTTWVDGSESDCTHIGNLIQKLDLVVAACNKMPDNGLLSKYKLHKRTKAMVACYPGNGTHYKKHIDNPSKDGRCITCIYYLNPNWDVKRYGGLLRMFPASRDSDVAQIEPIFDRMIFFWSDRRNPHEVLPALATRFAITVWYFDADERDAALKAIRQKQQLQSAIQPLN